MACTDRRAKGHHANHGLFPVAKPSCVCMFGNRSPTRHADRMAKFSDGPSQMTSGLKSHGSGLEVSGFRRVILELCRNAGHLPNLCGHLLVVLGGNSGSTDLDRRPGELRATHRIVGFSGTCTFDMAIAECDGQVHDFLMLQTFNSVRLLVRECTESTYDCDEGYVFSSSLSLAEFLVVLAFSSTCIS